MLMCRGKGCNWRRQCSRYVLGRGITPTVDVSAEWMDHCLRHQDKFIRIGWADGEGPIKEGSPAAQNLSKSETKSL